MRTPSPINWSFAEVIKIDQPRSIQLESAPDRGTIISQVQDAAADALAHKRYAGQTFTMIISGRLSISGHAGIV